MKVPVSHRHAAHDTSSFHCWTACARMRHSADWLHLLCLGHRGSASIKTTMVLLSSMNSRMKILMLMKIIHVESTPSKLQTELDQLCLVML